MSKDRSGADISDREYFRIFREMELGDQEGSYVEYHAFAEHREMVRQESFDPMLQHMDGDTWNPSYESRFKR